MNGTVIGIDLGTCNIKFSGKPGHLLTYEKNIIALENGHLYAYGDDAFEMYEKSPDNILVSFPIQSGVIADYNNMQRMLNRFLEKYFRNKLKGATVLIAVPTDITEVEKRAYFDLVDSNKYKLGNIYACEKPIATAVGLGLPINDASGMLICDIGADTTEISVLSLGGIVISRLLKVGGNHMINAIVSAIKTEHSLVIGYKTATNILSTIGYACDVEETSIKVVGRNMLTGFPFSVEIDSQLVYNAIQSYFNQIVDSIKFILERTPPELTSDIIDNGIYLSGGVSQINNIAKLISREVELDVNISEHPIENIAFGLSAIADDPHLLNLITLKKGKGKR